MERSLQENTVNRLYTVTLHRLNRLTYTVTDFSHENLRKEVSHEKIVNKLFPRKLTKRSLHDFTVNKNFPEERYKNFIREHR